MALNLSHKPCAENYTKFQRYTCYFFDCSHYFIHCGGDDRISANMFSETAELEKLFSFYLLTTDEKFSSCLTNETIIKQFENCANKCLNPCVNWVYDASFVVIRTLDLPTDEKNVIALTVFIEPPFSFTEIIETKIYSWETLVSNIVGQLGLWLGASALSLIQLLYAGFAACYNHEK